MLIRTIALLGAIVSLPALANAPLPGKDAAAPKKAGMRLAQQYYQNQYYGGPNGYYYPPVYDQRPPPADGWGWNGRGWGNTYSGGWQAIPVPGSGSGGNNWGGPPNGGLPGGGFSRGPQGGGANRW